MSMLVSTNKKSKTVLIQLAHGASLIEVLVAMFVLGVGLLGVISLQAESLRLNQQSYSSTQALVLASDMAERIRANREAFLAGNTAQVNNGNADLVDWQGRVANQLPAGEGVVEPAPAGVDGDGNPLPPALHVRVSYAQGALENENRTPDVSTVNYMLRVTL